MKNKTNIIILFLTIFFLRCGSEFGVLFDENDKGLPDGIYWVESEGTVNYINYDRTGRKTIYTSQNPSPFYVDIDIKDHKVYWTAVTDTLFQIKSVKYDGTSKEDVYSYSNSDGFGPSSIAIDRSNSAILFNQYVIANPHANQNANTNYIMRSVISTIPLNPVNWIPDINYKYIYSMCVDSINRKVYYSANSYYSVAGGTPAGSGNNGSVYIGELDTAAANYDQKISDVGPAGDSLPFRGIAVDGAGGYVYYVFINSSSSLNIMRANLALTGFTTWITADSFSIDKIALDLKNRKIYWTSVSDKSIYRADMDAADSNVEIFLTLTNTPTGIAVSQ